MKIYSPAGAVGRQIQGLAAPPKPLSEARIVGLDNRKPGAAVLIEGVGKRIADITGATWIGVRAKRTAATPVEDDLLQELVNDADYVITGTAD